MFLFFSIYSLIIFLYSLFVYKKSLIYYTPIYTYDENNKKINIHSLFPEFSLYDKKVSFWRIFIGSYLMMPIKIILAAISAILCIVQLKYYLSIFKNPETNIEERKIISSVSSRYTYWLSVIMCLKYVKKDISEEKIKNIYTKYLGKNYNFSQNNYSLIICNHIGFFEVLYNMIYKYSGFIAKYPIKNYYFIGPIAQSINCLFVNRENQTDRDIIFKKILNRQNDFYNKKILEPLCIFPEGTTTNGKYLLKFKKGAFYNLLPVKPEIINAYKEDEFVLSTGASNIVYNFLRSLCYLNHRMYYIDLPVIYPTEYMYENYKNYGNEKWEIFAEVCREIMCEIGEFKKSDKSFRDKKVYMNALLTGVYKEVLDEKDKEFINDILNENCSNDNDNKEKLI